MQPAPQSMLFVCTGNICRSPLAEGVFREIAKISNRANMRFDSAALGDWHVGEPPDPRSIKVGAVHGVPIHDQTCRTVTKADFSRFDLILGMDSSHVQALNRLKPERSTAHVALFMTLCSQRNEDVPDPYYGDIGDFERVYGMIRGAAECWFERFGSVSSGQDSSIT